MDAIDTNQFLMDMFTALDMSDHGLFDQAMTRARTVDLLGRAPIDDDWTPSFDEWFAAAEVAELLHLRGAMSPAESIKQATSEGATFIFSETATDWRAVAAHLRSRSTLSAASTGWAMVAVPTESPDFSPRSEVW